MRFYVAFLGLLVRLGISSYVHWPSCELCDCILAHTELWDRGISAGHGFCEQYPLELCVCVWQPQWEASPCCHWDINSVSSWLQLSLHPHPSLLVIILCLQYLLLCPNFLFERLDYFLFSNIIFGLGVLNLGHLHL